MNLAQFFFDYRLFIVNTISLALLYIVLIYSNVPIFSFLTYTIAILISNYFCLNQKSYIASQYMWLLFYGGFVLNPSLSLFLMDRNHYDFGYINYATITLLSLGLVAGCFGKLLHKKNISGESFAYSKYTPIIVISILIFISSIIILNFNYQIIFRGIDTATIYNPILVNFLNLCLNFFIPALIAFIVHNLFPKIKDIHILIFLLTYFAAMASAGSRFPILILFCILFEVYRRKIYLKNLTLLILFISLISSFYVTQLKRDKAFSGTIDNSLLDSAEITATATLHRFVGLDGVNVIQNHISRLNVEELQKFKQNTLHEKRKSYEASFYESIVTGISSKQIGLTYKKYNTNFTHVPGVIGFMSIFFNLIEIFIFFSLLVVIIHYLEYLFHKIFLGNWLFLSVFIMIIVNRIINSGVYFSDTYKILIGLTILLLFYYLLMKSKNIKYISKIFDQNKKISK